jgi:hypothetical protein
MRALLTPGAATIIATLLAAPAIAQTQASSNPDPVESAVVRLGPVGINPSLAVRDIGVDNNVFHESDNPKSDFTFTVTPKAEVLFSPRRVHLTFSTAVDYVYFETYDSERGTNQTSEVKANLDFGRLQPFVSMSGANTRERYNSEVDVRARHRDRTYSGGAALKLASRTTLSGTLRRTTTDFEEGSVFRGEDLAVAFNNRLDGVDGSLGMQLTPFTSISLVVSQEWQRFDLAPDRDSDTMRITPTLTFSPGGLLNGSAAIGYRRFDGRSAELPDYSGLVAVVNVGVTILGRHRLDTSFARDVRYSYEETTPYYLSTGGTATLTTQVSGPFDVRVTGTHQVLDYSQSNSGTPDDTYTSYGAGVGYKIRQRLRVGLNFERAHRDSEVATDRAFRNNRVFATLTWGTPQ